MDVFIAGDVCARGGIAQGEGEDTTVLFCCYVVQKQKAR